MALESTMLALGTPAPDFDLPDAVGGGRVKLNELNSKALVVMFICNHCPYVKHVQAGLASFGKDYADADVDIIAISSNDVAQYPDDSPEQIAIISREVGYTFPVLFDESQDVAKAYTAACTPDFFLFGSDRKLVYRGRFDESRPNSGVPVTGSDLRAALDAVLADTALPADQFPSMGCGIKWTPGKEPG